MSFCKPHRWFEKIVHFCRLKALVFGVKNLLVVGELGFYSIGKIDIIYRLFITILRENRLTWELFYKNNRFLRLGKILRLARIFGFLFIHHIYIHFWLILRYWNRLTRKSVDLFFLRLCKWLCFITVE